MSASVKAPKKVGPRAALKLSNTPQDTKIGTGNDANGSNSPTVQIYGSRHVKYDQLLSLLTCSQCSTFCSRGPVVHCRKGHVYCANCKAGQTSCKTCKQTFVDMSNLVLDKIVSTIALSCSFKDNGCEKFVFQDQRLDHETFCPYRPVSCRFATLGCELETTYKEIHQHHKVCTWNPDLAKANA